MPRITELETANSVGNTDFLVIVSDPSTLAETKKISVNTFFSNVSTLQVNNLVIFESNTPANSTITISAGKLLIDNNYIYYAVANNILKRIALESF